MAQKRKFVLDAHDEALVEAVLKQANAAISGAHKPEAVRGRIRIVIQGLRNKYRRAAMNAHPFKGVCEATGRPIDRKHAHLDETDPDLGYLGPCRWVCEKCNGSGPVSCRDS